MYSRADQVRTIQKQKGCSLQEAKRILETRESREFLMRKAAEARDISDLRAVVQQLIDKVYASH